MKFDFWVPWAPKKIEKSVLNINLIFWGPLGPQNIMCGFFENQIFHFWVFFWFLSPWDPDNRISCQKTNFMDWFFSSGSQHWLLFGSLWSHGRSLRSQGPFDFAITFFSPLDGPDPIKRCDGFPGRWWDRAPRGWMPSRPKETYKT